MLKIAVLNLVFFILGICLGLLCAPFLLDGRDNKVQPDNKLVERNKEGKKQNAALSVNNNSQDVSKVKVLGEQGELIKKAISAVPLPEVKRGSGTITGRVVFSDGRPFPGAGSRRPRSASCWPRHRSPWEPLTGRWR